MRKKNPHPQRAVNAKTVVVASDREEREERLKREEERALLCLRIPDDEEEEEDEQIQKEEMTVRKGVRERERTNVMCVRRCFDIHPNWPNTCVRTRKRNRTNAKCARSVLLELVV